MSNPQLFDDIKNILVDVLGVDHDEISPSANFFDDLGGESIDVIDLSFRCETKFKVPIKFQELSHARLDESEVNSESNEEILNSLRETFPFLPTYAELVSEPGRDVKSLFTVDAIVKTVEHALARHNGKRVTPANTSPAAHKA